MKSTGKNVLSEITLAGPVLTRAITPPPRMMAGSVRILATNFSRKSRKQRKSANK